MRCRVVDYVQVRLAVNRNQDLAMNAGRAAVEVEYDIGFDAEGKLLAVEMQAYLMGGAQLSGSFVDLYQLTGNIDQVSLAVSSCPTTFLHGIPWV